MQKDRRNHGRRSLIYSAVWTRGRKHTPGETMTTFAQRLVSEETLAVLCLLWGGTFLIITRFSIGGPLGSLTGATGLVRHDSGHQFPGGVGQVPRATADAQDRVGCGPHRVCGT